MPIPIGEAPQELVAPAPIIDKYPVVLGNGLTGQNVSAAMRLCTQGWRYQFVDILNELLECSWNARGVVRARITGVANGRHEILPGVKKKSPDYQQALEIADEYSEQFLAIPRLTQHTGQLVWGDIYGESGMENIWDVNGSKWEIIGLSHIHSRRINHPNPSSWEPYIYDQGLPSTGDYIGPATGTFGYRVSQYPGKFTIHAPAMNGDYPTRDGEGRYIVYCLLFERMTMRATAQDFERVIKPWVLGYYNRKLSSGAERSVATPEDQQILLAVTRALASGGLLSGVLPDSTKVEVLRAAAAMSAAEWLSALNRGLAKSLLGQSFTTEPGANGNLATAEQAARDTLKVFRYSARCLCDTLEESIARVWLKLNYPKLPRRFIPRHIIHVDELPSPADYMKMVAEGAKNIPTLLPRLDLDDLAEKTGVALISEEDALQKLNATPLEAPRLPPKEPRTTDDSSEGIEKSGGAAEKPTKSKSGKGASPAPEAST